MRHILLAAATIGAVSAVALSISSEPIADSGSNLKTLPASYAYPAGAGPDALQGPGGHGWAASRSGGASLDTPSADDAANAAADDESTPTHARIERVRRGDTLITVMTRAGASTTDAREAALALRDIYNPKALKIGQEIKLTFAPAPDDRRDLHSVSLQASIERDVAVHRDEAGDFRPKQTGRVLKPSLGRAGAMIETSLFKAGTNAGVPVEVMFELIRAFSYDVDFQRDLQPGDSFEVVFEQTHDASGRRVKTGHMIYGALSLSGNLLELYRYDPHDGSGPDFFNPKGESVKKALLRT